jgi:16S rRNA (uracil1498-N3)-methyltransferase
MPPRPDPLPPEREKGTAGLHRFFVDPAILGGERVALTGPLAHQISRVLRLKGGDRVVLLDGAGREAVVRLDEVRSSGVTGTVDLVRASRPEPSLSLTLYQALVSRDRFEVVLQKGTEIGVRRFVPTWCERSIVPGERIDEKRLERWRRIVTEAAEQCERGIVPEVAPLTRFADALAEAVAAGPTVIAWEREPERSVQAGIRAALAADRRVLCLTIGPEGGFTEPEIELARQAGALTVSLGPRILRTETAGPVLAALALYEAGDLEPGS